MNKVTCVYPSETCVVWGIWTEKMISMKLLVSQLVLLLSSIWLPIYAPLMGVLALASIYEADQFFDMSFSSSLSKHYIHQTI